MVRSLYCGISGLRAEQVAMDVVGNNIANVNTTGFKSGRVTFKESMAQLLKGASRPPGNAGGTNPMQIGLGTSVGSIDSILTQGNLQSTGQITDLALEGRAYFAFSNGEGTFYSRNGALQLDANGKLVSPTNGYALQGMTAANDGTFPVGSTIGDITIPYGEKSPAKATTTIGYACNLDSDSEALGTVLNTNRFLHDVQGAGAPNTATDSLTSLYDQNGTSLGIEAGDVLTISASDPLGNISSQTIKVNANNTITSLGDLATAIQTVANQANGGFTAVSMANGKLTVDATTGGANILNLEVTSNRPMSNSYVSNAFTFPPTIIAGPAGTAVSTMTLFRPAENADFLSEVFDASGQPLGLENGDMVSINGAVGGKTIPTATLTYADGVVPGTSTTMNDLLLAIQQSFSLPANDGTPYQRPSVTMDAADSPDDKIPDGAIAIRGRQETAFALSNVSIMANNSNNNAVAPTRFNANNSTTEVQTARDTGQQATSIIVYDESGDSHTVTTTFTNSGIPGEWLWQITTDGGESILGGNTGRITFGQDGSPSSFTFDDNSTAFRFDPMNGSNEVDISLNVGSPGSFKGITQFRSPSTTAARSQDGYPMGKLSDVSIDEYGVISGIYTNGINKDIAKIYVAEMNNPAGMLKVGDTMFEQSNNSGQPVMLTPGIGSATKIKPGALEMSNVELATEFTDMIVTERGYQASARVITMSDTLLNELVQLVR